MLHLDSTAFGKAFGTVPDRFARIVSLHLPMFWPSETNVLGINIFLIWI